MRPYPHMGPAIAFEMILGLTANESSDSGASRGGTVFQATPEGRALRNKVRRRRGLTAGQQRHTPRGRALSSQLVCHKPQAEANTSNKWSLTSVAGNGTPHRTLAWHTSYTKFHPTGHVPDMRDSRYTKDRNSTQPGSNGPNERRTTPTTSRHLT
jgi:hypothetical protein